MNTAAAAMATWMAAGLCVGAAMAPVSTRAADDGNGPGSLLPFEASYTFLYKGMTAGVTTLTLSRGDGGRWSYRSSGEARGIFRMLPIDNPTQNSEMRVTAGGVQPLSFSQRNGKSDERAVELRFDWDANRVQGTIEKKPVGEAVPPDTQDDLSVQIALITAMARGQDSGTLHTYGDRGLREYRYHADGEEMLHTAIGDVQTRMFVTERPDSPRVTRYWCAPSLGYLPLRVQQKRLDDVEWTLEVRTLKRG